jgi:hypothetical protein
MVDMENITKVIVDDAQAWQTCPIEWLWIYDKVIVARQQSILAAPSGVPVPRDDWYIIRPITNCWMMARGARKIYLRPGDESLVPDGYFWSEILAGDHVSVDYHHGQQGLTVMGTRDDPNRLDRFDSWHKMSGEFPLPRFLKGLDSHAEWINVEYIGDRAIEVHLRYNDDFANHDADVIYPVWRDSSGSQPPGTEWYESPCADRLGFWVHGTITHK